MGTKGGGFRSEELGHGRLLRGTLSWVSGVCSLPYQQPSSVYLRAHFRDLVLFNQHVGRKYSLTRPFGKRFTVSFVLAFCYRHNLQHCQLPGSRKDCWWASRTLVSPWSTWRRSLNLQPRYPGPARSAIPYHRHQVSHDILSCTWTLMLVR